MSQVIAIEGGGTRSTAGLYDAKRTLLGQATAGPANPVAYGLGQTLDTTKALIDALEVRRDFTLLAGLAGVYDDALRQETAQALANTTGATSVLVTTDVHPVLAANTMDRPGILVVAGTGSNVLAREPDGPVHQVGGRGALLGDEGSSYGIAVEALRAAARSLDGLQAETRLPDVLPGAAGLTDFEAFVRWGMTAAKADIAALAKAVLATADEGDAVAESIVATQARALGAQVGRAKEILGGGSGLPVYGIGGLLEHETRFAREFTRILREEFDLEAQTPPLAGHRAVFELSRLENLPPWAARAENVRAEGMLPATESMETTHPPLDSLEAIEIVRTMNAGDDAVVRAVGDCAASIAQVINLAAEAIQSGGRILYCGAGTSGRLGVLDASECPPTFGIPAERVVGIIAGGERALRHSVEGAEDDRAQAVRDLDLLALTSKDLLVGVAASGTTPYVLAGLASAAERGARTALVCCNPKVTAGAEVIVALNTGTEVLPGSTRLKAGTATKMVLNMITTGAMARSGYVVDGLMAGMTPKNAKLRERAVRIVARLSADDDTNAHHALESADWHIGHAVLIARDGLTPDAAAQAFANADGNLRRALAGGRTWSAGATKLPP